MKIGLIADWLNPCMTEMLSALRAKGSAVDVVYPERELINLNSLEAVHDLYVLKSGTDAALSLGGMLDTLGATTLNPYSTVVTLRNKALVTHALRVAGVPVPETYLTSDADHVVSLLRGGPLILKPPRGSRGEGIQIVRKPCETRTFELCGSTLVQRYHEPDGPDHKLYRIGDQLFGVRRRWPLRSYADKLGEAFIPEGQLREIGFRCGEVFGIDLYGLDVVMSGGRPFVVDLNKFGSFMGVPDGPRLLADYLLGASAK